MRDDCLVVDVARLNRVLVVPQDNEASAGPGVNGGQLLAALEPHGLTFPVGHHRNVALGGYLIGGGVGWNANFLGIACANVQSIEMLDAEGHRLVAGPESHPDLLWAVRGGGPSFPGIVTRYDLAVFPEAHVMAYREWQFPLSGVREAADWVKSAAAKMGPRGEVLCWAGIRTDYASDNPTGDRVVLVRTLAFAESDAQARGMLTSLDSLPAPGCPSAECRGQPAVRQVSWRQLFDWSDRLYRAGRRYAMDAMWLRGDPNEILPQLADEIARAPSPYTRLMLSFASGEPASAKPDAMAFAPNGDFYVLVEAIWQGDVQDSANLQWLHGLITTLEPRAAAFTTNGSDWVNRPERTRRCFPEQNWRRLTEIARRYDPDNMFFTRSEASR